MLIKGVDQRNTMYNGRHISSDIFEILSAHRIPWIRNREKNGANSVVALFDEAVDRACGNIGDFSEAVSAIQKVVKENSQNGRGYFSNDGLNIFPSACEGELCDNLLCICGSNGLKPIFGEMIEWMEQHKTDVDKQLTITLLTTKWNPNAFREYESKLVGLARQLGKNGGVEICFILANNYGATTIPFDYKLKPVSYILY